MVPVMSSLRSVELVVVPPPQAASAVANEVSNADQTPSRLPGFLNALPPFKSDFLCLGRHAGCLHGISTLWRLLPWVFAPRLPHGAKVLGAACDRPLEDRVPRVRVEEMESRRIQCK